MDDLNPILQGYSRANVAVIGDICLDMYYFLSDERSEISVETGLPTRSVSEFSHEAGGAGNVAINLKAIGAGNVDSFGVVGEDPFGSTLVSIMKDAGVNCRNIITQNENWNTHVYHKLYKDGAEEPRCDIGNFNRAANSTIDRLLDTLESGISSYDAVIINEQIEHGYHTGYFQDRLNDIIRKHQECLWITDCRHLNNTYEHTIRKLNISEALSLYRRLNKSGTASPDKTDILSFLASRWKKPVIITLGENGAVAADTRGSFYQVNGINIIGQTDTVGAGDAFLSAFALTMASGGSIEEALELGNLSAAVSVKKVFQTGHPTAEEISSAAVSTDYRYNPSKAEDPRTAEYISGSLIELISLKRTNYPRVAIFDHDGTISTLRQGWEPIMKDVCVRAILGKSFEYAPAGETAVVSSAAEDMIEKTTGVQTIIQMHHLRDMVLSFGYVDDDDVLSPAEYKKIYNDRLLAMVSERVKLLKKGLLSVEDVTIKGALDFLSDLKARGVSIYLASGTDQEDVREEAATLGYNSLFNGGIYGSTGDISSDPKREVIRTIINSLPEGISSDECYVFGDGPVEMREAAKCGFTRIGLVSDEKQRYGINLDKRSRLILGGAQALIPDFSWIPALGSYLGWREN